MKPKEAYLKYKGKCGIYTYNDSAKPSRGIIVGYTTIEIYADTPLIMRVYSGYSWSNLDNGDHIVCNKTTCHRYQYCSINNVSFKYGK